MKRIEKWRERTAEERRRNVRENEKRGQEDGVDFDRSDNIQVKRGVGISE